MRFSLIGNANIDTWIEFKSVYFDGRTICKFFINKNSPEASEYITRAYYKMTGGSYGI